jgi:hypothetical protein
MKTISDEDIIKAYTNLLDFLNLDVIEKADILNKFSKDPYIKISIVLKILRVYDLQCALIDSDRYLIFSKDTNIVEDIDFASGVYKWVARFGGVQ